MKANEEVFRPPKRGQPGHRTVRIIGVPGSRTWGVGGRRISAPPYHPYLWVIWVMNLNPSSQKKTQSQTAPRPTQSPPTPSPPHAPSGQHRRHMGGSSPNLTYVDPQLIARPNSPLFRQSNLIICHFHFYFCSLL